MRTRTFRWIANHSASVSVMWVLGLVLVREAPTAAQTTRCQPANEPHAEDTNPFNPDRPGIADGSTVIGPGRFQLEAGYQQELRRADGSTEHRHLVPTLLRVGIGCHWEARFESNTFTQVDASGPEGVGDRTSGIAPVSIGVKFNVRADPHRLKLGTILRVFPASGTDGPRTKHATGDLRFAADWDLPRGLSLNPNVGVALYEDDDNHKTFAAGLFALTLSEFNQAKTIGPFVDVGVLVPEASIPGSSFILDAGVAYLLPCHNVQIDVSAGTGPHGRTPPRLFVSVGISVRFRA
jgi:hypothetical protein